MVYSGQVEKRIMDAKQSGHLNLAGSCLTEIPGEVFELTNLTTLDLDCNQIKVIPDAIGQLTNLTELHLWDNQITVVPDAIAKLKQKGTRIFVYGSTTL